MATNAPYGVGKNTYATASGGAAGQNVSSGSGGLMGNLMSGGADLLNDRNVQQFMAELGTSMDPQGAGGMIGQPTSNMIERQAQQDSMKQLLNMLGEGGQINQGPDGSTSLKVGKGAITGEGGDTPGGATSQGSELADQDQDSFDLDTMLGNLSGMTLNVGG